jgi:hypothetical protein
VLSVAARPSASLPLVVKHVYPSGIPPLANTVIKHASKLAVVAASNPLCDMLAAAKAASRADLMLAAAVVASESVESETVDVLTRVDTTVI